MPQGQAFEELCDKVIGSVANTTPGLSPNDAYGVIFSGSKSYTIDDAFSDIDVVVVAPAYQSQSAYYTTIDGIVTDVVVTNDSSLRRQLTSSQLVDPGLKDKLLYSNPLPLDKGFDTTGLLQDGYQAAIDGFFDFLSSQARRAGKDHKPIRFSLQSLADWPHIIHVLLHPQHKHRIAKRLSSPVQQEVEAKHKAVYAEILSARFGDVCGIAGDDYVLERHAGREAFPSPQQIIMDCFSERLHARIQKTASKLSLENVKAGKASSYMTKVLPKLKRLAFDTTESAYAYWQAANGGLFSLAEEGKTCRFKSVGLEAVSSDSPLYRLLHEQYAALRIAGHQDLRMQLAQNQVIYRTDL